MTATERPVSVAGGRGTIQPSSQARLTIARRRAEAPGELGEVVRRVQLVDRLAPAVAVDEVVPVGDQVAERAAVVAERHAALHAARALLAQTLDRQRGEELSVVANALARIAFRRVDPLDLEEPAELAHQAACSVAT
jgi:hypothetical protein